ncbi:MULTISPECIES: leucyl/phenylalanyl-tRNA--protein transferase [Flavobacterium]|jgi:leucyl/phenylalanyl-tRNA--protein transferase|uniref:Leucyl/phenylalanyl-tRNA--protein transferase n=1 Tax=Flavobacterium anhuiense TaxID=459526 RepID=A0ABY0L5C3_9FLAO|nr:MULTISPECIES: leucyl/phenylalanyl-tRNA--protein transferase [Flavobacterium]EJG00632.1 leucyl/phenylalanyl-tRNA--protein transferase [Flavobacterium sp. F52]URM38389.1 leucyl/phenylalanyl-tRNA--protein transferase [Flavobacterium anhuiense]SCX79258.1 leucyl/phenylalanyl-tRNA--protein transferase [Flavobacterium anhuiense]
MYYLFNDLYFPPVTEADEEGILAIGGDLSPERLLLAYKSGIFPWFNEGEPILWWAPDPRMVLFFDELAISKSMRKILNKKMFKVTYNKNFKEVILNCQQIKREGQDGTWISDEMIEAYCKLNEEGVAKSVEVWQDDVLVGGLYGIDLGKGNIFCGESMFSKVSNASKTAFIALALYLKKENYKLLDCQVYNPHLESLGCREIDRDEFMSILKSK